MAQIGIFQASLSILDRTQLVRLSHYAHAFGGSPLSEPTDAILAAAGAIAFLLLGAMAMPALVVAGRLCRPAAVWIAQKIVWALFWAGVRKALRWLLSLML